MSWSHYLQLIRQKSTDLDEWYALVEKNENEGDPIGEIGSAMFDVLSEARKKGEVFRGFSTILLSFIKQAADLQQRVAELETENASARTEVLFLQDRVSPQDSYEGLHELFRQQNEIRQAIIRTAEVVFPSGSFVYWEHNGHRQYGCVDRVDCWGQVWVRNQRTGVLRRLQPYEVRPESVVAAYGMETADVA